MSKGRRDVTLFKKDMRDYGDALARGHAAEKPRGKERTPASFDKEVDEVITQYNQKKELSIVFNRIDGWLNGLPVFRQAQHNRFTQMYALLSKVWKDQENNVDFYLKYLEIYAVLRTTQLYTTNFEGDWKSKVDLTQLQMIALGLRLLSDQALSEPRKTVFLTALKNFKKNTGLTPLNFQFLPLDQSLQQIIKANYRLAIQAERAPVTVASESTAAALAAFGALSNLPLSLVRTPLTP